MVEHGLAQLISFWGVWTGEGEQRGGAVGRDGEVVVGYETRRVEAPFVGDDAPQVLTCAGGTGVQQPLQAVEFWWRFQHGAQYSRDLPLVDDERGGMGHLVVEGAGRAVVLLGLPIGVRGSPSIGLVVGGLDQFPPDRGPSGGG